MKEKGYLVMVIRIQLSLIIALLSLGLAGCNYKIDDIIKIYEVEESEEDGIIYNTEWQSHYDPATAYYNSTQDILNIYEGPGAGYQVIAYAKPREGGFVENCNFDLQYCYINFGGKPKSGWVDMRYLKQGQIEYRK
ncbi:MAG: hypothetical protein R3D88_04645 [Alphaproteobacteria bacterium]|nr:hypothetical protein [Alphaproteobacteria bacterium]